MSPIIVFLIVTFEPIRQFFPIRTSCSITVLLPIMVLNPILTFLPMKKFLPNVIHHSNDAKVISLYIKCLCELKKLDDVKQFIASLSDKLSSDQDIQKAIKIYEMLETASKMPSIEMLLSTYNKEPNNIINVLKLSEKFFYDKQTEQALELLLSNFSK